LECRFGTIILLDSRFELKSIDNVFYLTVDMIFKDLQVNKVSPIMELNNHLIDKRLSEQILRYVLRLYYVNKC